MELLPQLRYNESCSHLQESNIRWGGVMSEKADEEMLEIWDWETGRPTGKAISRSEAHQKGIAHECVNLWIIRTSGDEPEILFQRRAPMTENPDYLDITVGGHVPLGYGKDIIQKEASEEIGITPRPEDLIDIGFYRYEEKSENRLHREFQHVYLLRDNRPLTDYRFADGEVIQLYAVPLSGLEKLLREEGSLPVEAYDGNGIIRTLISRKDFHPLIFDPSMKGYIELITKSVKELIRTGSVTCQYVRKIQLCKED